MLQEIQQKIFREKMIKESEILSLLKDIEEGKLKIEPTKVPLDIYSGNVIYNISNGWQITIFNDANTWDYIDNIKATDGREISFDEIDNILSLRNYEPSKKTCIDIYKIGI